MNVKAPCCIAQLIRVLHLRVTLHVTPSSHRIELTNFTVLFHLLLSCLFDNLLLVRQSKLNFE